MSDPDHEPLAAARAAWRLDCERLGVTISEYVPEWRDDDEGAAQRLAKINVTAANLHAIKLELHPERAELENFTLEDIERISADDSAESFAALLRLTHADVQTDEDIANVTGPAREWVAERMEATERAESRDRRSAKPIDEFLALCPGYTLADLRARGSRDLQLVRAAATWALMHPEEAREFGAGRRRQLRAFDDIDNVADFAGDPLGDHVGDYGEPPAPIVYEAAKRRRSVVAALAEIFDCQRDTIYKRERAHTKLIGRSEVAPWRVRRATAAELRRPWPDDVNDQWLLRAGVFYRMSHRLPGRASGIPRPGLSAAEHDTGWESKLRKIAEDPALRPWLAELQWAKVPAVTGSNA
jgi:hypothetical protein